MKLIKLVLEGIDLFDDGKLEIDFYATDRVVNQDSVFKLQDTIYSQNIVAVAGVNAVGKTSVLSLIELAIRIVFGEACDNEYIPLAEKMSGGFSLKAVLWNQNSFLFLDSTITIEENKQQWLVSPKLYKLYFQEELLYILDKKLRSRKTINDFAALCEEATRYERRSDIVNFDEGLYLRNDVSIISRYTKSLSTKMKTLFGEAINPGSIEPTIIQAFDSSIEYIANRPDDENVFSVKFKTEKDEKTLFSFELASVLSAGTVRGSGLVLHAIEVLKTGGYFLIDEIENHLNKQLVGVIISLFATSETNPFGATLIFTTHYPEVLDFIQRKDNVFFLIRNANHKTEVIRYSDRMKRIENKKSEVFLSNYIEGTAPDYSEIIALKNYVSMAVRSHGDT